MIAPASGTLLIADPFLKDLNFMRTVIFLCEHQEVGSFGFVLNKRLKQSLQEIITDLNGFDIPIYFGGPVYSEKIHFLHTYPEHIEGAIEVLPGVFWGGNFESLLVLIKNNEIDTNKVRFFIGYSCWREGQLAGELEEKSWLTVEATRKLIFETEPEYVWKDSLRALGGEYEMMINFPIDPQLN